MLKRIIIIAKYELYVSEETKVSDVEERIRETFEEELEMFSATDNDDNARLTDVMCGTEVSISYGGD